MSMLNYRGNRAAMSGIGRKGRGRPPLVGRGRGRTSPEAASSSEATIPALPAGDHVPLLPEPLKPHGSGAGSIVAHPPPVQPVAPTAAAPIPGIDYQQLEAIM